MSWETLTLLLIQFGVRGFDLADKLIANWTSKEPVTAADIAELKKLGTRTPREALIEALVRAGKPLDSSEAVALLALVP